MAARGTRSSGGGRRESAGPGLEDDDLEAAHPLLPGELRLDGGARAQGHGDELADLPVAHLDAVEPGLGRADQVVLGVGPERLVPGVAGQRVDPTEADLDRVRLPPGRLETEPEGLALVHREEHAARLARRLGHAIGELLDPADRERAQAGRQGVGPAVVGIGVSAGTRPRSVPRPVPDRVPRRCPSRDLCPLGCPDDPAAPAGRSAVDGTCGGASPRITRARQASPKANRVGCRPSNIPS